MPVRLGHLCIWIAKCGNRRRSTETPLPFVPFEVLQLDPQDVLFVVGQHVDVLVAQPELLGGVAEAVLVVVPVAVEVLAGVAEVVAALDHLQKDQEVKNGFLRGPAN
jgi:hypothetical protein